MDNTKVSIIIPTYNRKALLPRAINSLLNQTYSNFEIIIVDDGSTDGTEAVVKKLFKDDRIRYFLLKKNSGACNARNFGVDKTKCKYIAYLDSDNYLYSNWLNEMMSYFNVHKWCKWLYPRLNRKYIINGKQILFPLESLNLECDKKIHLLWTYKVDADPTGLVINREILNKKVKWDSEIEIYQDYDYAIQLSKICPEGFSVHPFVLGVYIRDFGITSIGQGNTHLKLAENLTKINKKHSDLKEFIGMNGINEKIERYLEYDKMNISVTDHILEKYGNL
ncbi:MAG: glycosyltransferase family 2 protein [bacterium]|nr:glycosyltransferase family 2 protein [bacterium]